MVTSPGRPSGELSELKGPEIVGQRFTSVYWS
jgi:hypothetical protein